MQPISNARHQFPAEIIRHATWLYLRFTLSYRDVEELLVERGIETSYESIRRWVLKFGPLFARNLRRLRPRSTGRWHLDEMVVSIRRSCMPIRPAALVARSASLCPNAEARGRPASSRPKATIAVSFSNSVSAVALMTALQKHRRGKEAPFSVDG